MRPEVPGVAGLVRDGGHQLAVPGAPVELQVLHDEAPEGDLQRVAVRLTLLEGGAKLLLRRNSIEEDILSFGNRDNHRVTHLVGYSLPLT